MTYLEKPENIIEETREQSRSINSSKKSEALRPWISNKINGIIDDDIENIATKLYKLEETLWNTLLIWKITDVQLKMATDLFEVMWTKKKELTGLITELTSSLYEENWNKISFEANIKAQIIIDIIIRNLYERTADVGFLSTDGEIRCFLYWLNTPNPSFETEIEKKKLQKRLEEYRSKYSVYSNIIVLDNDWNIVVSERQLDEKILTDWIIHNCTASWFSEYYGQVSFSKERELLYCQKITDSW